VPDSEVEDTGVLPLLDSPTTRGTVRMALVCVSGDDFGKAFRVSMAPMIIGRGNVDIALAGGESSRNHAQFRFGDNGFEIEDLKSSNGTLVNGKRIEGTARVRIGDRIQIGRTVLVFQQHDELAERVQRVQRLEAMATLAGGIAHDFNNALAVIVGNLDIVAAAIPASDAAARESMDEIQAATSSATALAKRLLRLGRGEPMSFGAVKLAPLAIQVTSMAKRRTKNPLEVAVDVPQDLRALGSHEELHQVLLNLCINAIDAMPNGGKLKITGRAVTLATDAAITRQLTGAGEFVEISVTDSGTGMDAATLARAFEPFFTTKPRDQGTGLGLAMIHITIRRHGGAIDVDSIVGKGSTFRITLPRHVNASTLAP
jgi:signal transduction histidine kinase